MQTNTQPRGNPRRRRHKPHTRASHPDEHTQALLTFIKAKCNHYSNILYYAQPHDVEVKTYANHYRAIYDNLYSTVYATRNDSYAVIAIHERQEWQLREIIDNDTLILARGNEELIITDALKSVELKPFPKQQF